MLKTFTVLSAVSMIGLSILAETPAYAGGKVCFRDENGVRHCVSKRQARTFTRIREHGNGSRGSVSEHQRVPDGMDSPATTDEAKLPMGGLVGAMVGEIPNPDLIDFGFCACTPPFTPKDQVR